jgi:hypothetical protein
MNGPFTTVKIQKDYNQKINMLQSELLLDDQIDISKKRLLEIILLYTEQHKKDFNTFLKDLAKDAPVTKAGVTMMR